MASSTGSPAPFLHFHEDRKGLFGDVRAADDKDFDRFDVTQGGDDLIVAAEARLTA
ncbi:MAG: hypothetical protein Q7T23_15295 [Phenylobacterium sp.]|nr:hypothetical protein [Phenylobacterium sp.]